MSDTAGSKRKSNSAKWKLWVGAAFLIVSIIAGGAVTAIDWGWNIHTVEQMLLVAFFITYCIGFGFSYVGLTELEKREEGETMLNVTKILLVVTLAIFAATVLLVEYSRYWEKINGQLLAWSKWIHLSLAVLAAIVTLLVTIFASKA